VQAPWHRGDEHAAAAEAVSERERQPASPALNLAASWFVCAE